MSNTIETLEGLISGNTIIGAPIEAEGVTLIPVSKVSFGVGGGGSDYISKNRKQEDSNTFGGGTAASVKIEPIAFLVIKEGNVKMLHVSPTPLTTADKVMDAFPDLVEKLSEFLDNQKKKKESTKDFEAETF